MRLLFALILSLTCFGFAGCSDPAPPPPPVITPDAGTSAPPASDGSTKAQNAPQEGALKAPIKD